MITSTGDSTETTIVRYRTAWRKFKELLSLLLSKSIFKKLWKPLEPTFEALFLIIVSVGFLGKIIC